MIKEFKEFVVRGNVMDLAVAVIIGGAFGKIVSSMVNDVLMPLIGLLLGGISFAELKYVISPASGDIPENAIRYGSFIQASIDFLVIAFVIFLFVRALGKMKKKQEAAPEAPPAPSKEEALLGEIRDLLKENR